jgi:hypothetical protein
MSDFLIYKYLIYKAIVVVYAVIGTSIVFYIIWRENRDNDE